MRRYPIDSSSLAAVGYDAGKRVLEVAFVHGGVYRYLDVPPEVVEELLSAESHGAYFAARIRPVYGFIRVR